MTGGLIGGEASKGWNRNYLQVVSLFVRLKRGLILVDTRIQRLIPCTIRCRTSPMPDGMGHPQIVNLGFS